MRKKSLRAQRAVLHKKERNPSCALFVALLCCRHEKILRHLLPSLLVLCAHTGELGSVPAGHGSPHSGSHTSAAVAPGRHPSGRAPVALGVAPFHRVELPGACLFAHQAAQLGPVFQAGSGSCRAAQFHQQPTNPPTIFFVALSCVPSSS